MKAKNYSIYLLVLALFASCGGGSLQTKNDFSSFNTGCDTQIPGELTARDFNKKGLCYMENGDLLLAETFFQNALTRKSQIKAAILNNLGVLYLRKGNVKAAQNYFQKGLKYGPKDLKLRLNLAETFILFGHGHKAKRILKGLSKEFPENEQVKEKLATLSGPTPAREVAHLQ